MGKMGFIASLKKNKHVIFQPKISITKKDLKDIPELEQTTNAIKVWGDILKKVSGKDAFIAKKALIDARKDQYIIKNAFKRPVIISQVTHSTNWIPLTSEEGIDENGNI